MQNNFKKIPLILASIFFVLLSLAFFFLYRAIHSNNQEAELHTIELEDNANQNNEVRLLNNSIKTIKEESALLGKHFAKSSDIVPFLDKIEGLALLVGIKAETTSVDVLAENMGLLVKIKAFGDFEGIYKFLKLLENSPYELEFIGMDMQKEASAIDLEGTPTQDSKWQATFNIKLLSFIP